jgi:hypothetical protein
MINVINKRIAQLWSLFSILFLSLMLFGHLFGDEGFNFTSVQEIIWFCFFPLGVYLGMIISFKWQGIGGLITVLSIVMFHLLSRTHFNYWIDGVSFPGFLNIIYWSLIFFQRPLPNTLKKE